jgi:hypothetical protein
LIKKFGSEDQDWLHVASSTDEVEVEDKKEDVSYGDQLTITYSLKDETNKKDSLFKRFLKFVGLRK